MHLALVRKTFYDKIKERSINSYLLEKEMYPFKMPELKYKTNALEPLFNQKQLENHYNFHHKGYVDQINNLFEK